MRTLHLLSFLILGTTSLITLTSCSHNNKAMMDKTDSLTAVVVRMEMEINALPVDSMKWIMDSIAFDVRMLESLIGDDTIQLKVATTIDNYSRIRRSFSKLQGSLAAQKNDIALAKKQLADMYADLEAEVMPPQAFQQFFPSESAAINSLSEANGSMLQWYSNSRDRYFALRPTIASLIAQRRDALKQAQ